MYARLDKTATRRGARNRKVKKAALKSDLIPKKVQSFKVGKFF